MNTFAAARLRIVLAALVGVVVSLGAAGCAQPEPEAEEPAVETVEYDPAVWAESHPEIFQTWMATSEERPPGLSKYKRGYDGGVMFDKLSEWPFMALLFNGFGFGIDYQEPRGHYYMMIDQSHVDPSRVRSGGACLTCKSPYAEQLYREDKDALFAATYEEAVAMLPEAHRSLGATCIDCHDNEVLELSTRRWTMDAAIREIGLEPHTLSMNQQRLMVCAQCHCTYSVMREDDRVVDIDYPWEGSEWGAITVENIIDALMTQPERLEWTQAVTGLRMPFIRHPDIEFYAANGSTHWMAGVTCADCHMGDITLNNKTVPNHNLMSPLKRDMQVCLRCHAATPEELKAEVIAIQDANAALLIDAGYRTATVAKLIERANPYLATADVGAKARFDEAVEHYRQGFYRVIYMGAENSVGFHNPQEGRRILGDAVTEVDQADAILRELLTSWGAPPPAEVPLELERYLTNRGVYAKGFVREQYFPDPTGQAERKWPESLGALLR